MNDKDAQRRRANIAIAVIIVVGVALRLIVTRAQGFPSDVGTFMQSVGAAWLMVSLNASPTYVALTQTAASLPFFVFALPAGAIGMKSRLRTGCRR